MKIVLASESPFRKRALDMLGLIQATAKRGGPAKARQADSLMP